jgi:uncharacterized membrane protein YfcA
MLELIRRMFTLCPQMSLTEIIGLILAAAAGGAINAIAGGGTLVTFPTLLFFGTSPKAANATSTLALVIGTSASIYSYRGHWTAIKPWLSRFVPISILGGVLGAALLYRTSERAFGKLVPFLILFATVLFVSQGVVRRFANLEAKSGHPHAIFGAILFQFAVAFYGGYFGAGIGILMLASLAFIGLNNIHEMNALKNLLGSLINFVAAVWFVFAGLVNWPKAGVMTIGALAGYFLGAHYSQRISQQRVRQIITAIGFVLSAITFYREFVK